MSNLLNNEINIEKNEDKKPKKDSFEIILPQRKIPSLIDELIQKDFPIMLSKDGYYVAGFYGLNADSNKKGMAFIQETIDQSVLVCFDHKGHKHFVRNFLDMVKFNNHIWGAFFKISDEFKKPDSLWFMHLLENGVLNITPGNVK